MNAVKQISYGDSIEVLDPGDFNCSIMIPNDYGETNATCIHLKLDGSSSSCGSCTVTGCQFEVTDAGIAERITINIQIDGISGSLFSFVLVVRGRSNGYRFTGIECHEDNTNKEIFQSELTESWQYIRLGHLSSQLWVLIVIRIYFYLISLTNGNYTSIQSVTYPNQQTNP